MIEYEDGQKYNKICLGIHQDSSIVMIVGLSKYDKYQGYVISWR